MSLETWEHQVEVFKKMGSPMRPHRSEVQILEELASDLAASSPDRPLAVLLLGVTEEIVLLAWPEDTMLTAVDRSPIMIAHFWPGDQPGRRRLVQADWFDMPFESSTFDLIVGDGVFNFMTYPDGYRQFARVLSNLLKPQGRACIRLFTQRSPKEDVSEILAEYKRSEEVDYHAFRYRLATSLQADVGQGIFITREALDAYLVSQGVHLAELYEKSGYQPPPPLDPPPQDDGGYRITYPTSAQFIAAVGDAFRIDDTRYGTHTLAHRTPVFVLAPL